MKAEIVIFYPFSIYVYPPYYVLRTDGTMVHFGTHMCDTWRSEGVGTDCLPGAPVAVAPVAALVARY